MDSCCDDSPNHSFNFLMFFAFQDAAESQRMAKGQKDHLDREVRKFRRRRLIKYHELEQDLLREVRKSSVD